MTYLIGLGLLVLALVAFFRIRSAVEGWRWERRRQRYVKSLNRVLWPILNRPITDEVCAEAEEAIRRHDEQWRG